MVPSDSIIRKLYTALTNKKTRLTVHLLFRMIYETNIK